MSMASEIKAIIRQSKLDEVVEALRGLTGLPGVTVSLVRGFGKAEADGRRRIEEGAMYKLEIVVPPALVEPVLKKIQEAAWTGQPGDGKIFVYDVAEVVNIRKKARGVAAI